MHPRHDFPRPYADAFQIGQAAVARIHAEIAQATMGKAAPDAFTPGYVPPLWRATQRRRFAEARAEYERAKAIMEMMQ